MTGPSESSDADHRPGDDLPTPFGQPEPSAAETYRLADPPARWSEPVVPVRALAPVEEAPQGSQKPRVKKTGSDFIQPLQKLASHEVSALIGFNAIVFVTSVCIMTLELTASRLIGKHVGNSLYTWTSVIGVVLAGITVGNYIGGYLADLPRPRRSLAWTFLISSITCWSVLWLDQLIPSFTRPASISWPMWVLMTVSLIFFLPACAMGTISPIVASLAVASSSRTGITMGNVYAWGALGSIVGTFLTGFYLIDQFGTRAIVGLVAMTLAAMALIIASKNKVFRTGVALGWCQLLGLTWGLATMTETSVASAAGFSARMVGVWEDPQTTDARTSRWRTYGETIGRQVHDLGLSLALRDDRQGEYHDESSYSYINVSEDYSEDGRPIKLLKLDKLIHSYYDPADPNRLDYDYEKVYAAITEMLAGSSEANIEIQVANFPGREQVVAQLPAALSWNPDRQSISLKPRAIVDWSALLKLAPDGAYIAAVNELSDLSTRADWGGFSSVAVTELPENFRIPQEINEILRYDRTLEMLSVWKPLDEKSRRLALATSPSIPWIDAIDELRKKSRKASSLFIGGGGYIFPRWIESQFPGSERIDVAELDPAVLAAVESEMGLAKPPATRVHSRIGDARNVVDDLLRESNQQGKIAYDFAYGDAFNDFSVPWHLTTKEFAEKIHQLLAPEGAYLVNVIDVYPRTVWPRIQDEEQQVTFDGEPPFAGWNEWNNSGWIETPGFAGFSLHRHGTRIFSLRFRGEMPASVENRLKSLSSASPAWRNAVTELAKKSRQPPRLAFELPAILIPSLLLDDEWTPAPAPFEFVEIRRVGTGYSLAVRGALTQDLKNRLLSLNPDNAAWKQGLEGLAKRSEKLASGRFLAAFVATLHQVFPHVAVFSSEAGSPNDNRDTFVIAASKTPIDWTQLEASDHWTGLPFATSSKVDETVKTTGQMESLLGLARGLILTDDHAPVDNLLLPVFETND